uniref:Uncharacterized protein n=1 Tax=Oryza sativa subsp. japonica TaxID=39947 RepID=Q109J7_ORYSJ|nr:hypothetical protein LOC_Os10g33484 [Oryza sativa Japonica Group]
MDIDVEVVVASRRRRRFKNEGARQPPGSSALLAWWIHTANGVVDRDKIVETRTKKEDDRPVTARFLQDESSKVVGGFDRREDALTEVGGGFWALGRVGELETALTVVVNHISTPHQRYPHNFTGEVSQTPPVIEDQDSLQSLHRTFIIDM